MNAIRVSRAAMVVSVMLTVTAALAVAFGGAAGCSTGNIYIWGCRQDGGPLNSDNSLTCTCPIECGCCTEGAPECGPYPKGDCSFLDAGTNDGDAGGTHGGDAGTDAGDGGDGGPLPLGCTGECLPSAPLGWTDPVLLALGTPTDSPACPEDAPTFMYGGYAGLDASPASCGACSCTSPTGTCALPASITASAALCNQDGGTVPFDLPAGWDGGCTAPEVLPPAASLQSVTITPLTAQESGCTPSPPVAVLAPVTWSTFAWACTGAPSGSCPGPGNQYCAPFGPVSGYLTCVWHDGDVDFPLLSPYTDCHVFYRTTDDTRSCSACACAVPTGSTCSAYVSVYSDAMCSTPVGSDLVGSNAPGCIEGIAGAAVGSVSAGAATYTPGACAPSGGDPTGSVIPVMPSTFCCLPPPMGNPT